MRSSPRIPRVCLIAPLPPPYGGIVRWAELIIGEAARTGKARLHVVDTAPHWREAHDLRIWRRAVFGAWHGLNQMGAVGLQMLRGAQVLHIATSGKLAIYRDIAMLRLARLFRVPVLYHLHFGRVPELARANNPEWRRLLKAMRLSSGVIPIDRDSLETLESTLPEVPLHLIPNCVDPKALPSITGAGPAQKTILFVGWLLPAKGIEELLEAWNLLDAPGWQLAILGPSSKDYLASLQGRFSLRNVSFLGEQAHPEVLNRIAQADIFTLPSHTEGFPNVVLEAMSLGRTVIATTVGAIPEMLDGGRCGVLVPAKDSGTLARQLQALIHDEPRRIQLGMAARDRFQAHYTLEAVFNKLLALWEAPR